jgi:hypothetical protein
MRVSLKTSAWQGRYNKKFGHLFPFLLNQDDFSGQKAPSCRLLMH